MDSCRFGQCGIADWPLTGAAVLFLAAYAVPILRPDVSAPAREVCDAAAWGTWALFAVGYAARLVLSRQRRRFGRTKCLPDPNLRVDPAALPESS